jgi:hypothetical protein
MDGRSQEGQQSGNLPHPRTIVLIDEKHSPDFVVFRLMLKE